MNNQTTTDVKLMFETFMQKKGFSQDQKVYFREKYLMATILDLAGRIVSYLGNDNIRTLAESLSSNKEEPMRILLDKLPAEKMQELVLESFENVAFDLLEAKYPMNPGSNKQA